MRGFMVSMNLPLGVRRLGAGCWCVGMCSGLPQ
jgi:hypothetical protein